jgi:hypothetical protein
LFDILLPFFWQHKNIDAVPERGKKIEGVLNLFEVGFSDANTAAARGVFVSTGAAERVLMPTGAAPCTSDSVPVSELNNKDEVKQASPVALDSIPADPNLVGLDVFDLHVPHSASVSDLTAHLEALQTKVLQLRRAANHELLKSGVSGMDTLSTKRHALYSALAAGGESVAQVYEKMLANAKTAVKDKLSSATEMAIQTLSVHSTAAAQTAATKSHHEASSVAYSDLGAVRDCMATNSLYCIMTRPVFRV